MLLPAEEAKVCLTRPWWPKVTPIIIWWYCLSLWTISDGGSTSVSMIKDAMNIRLKCNQASYWHFIRTLTFCMTRIAFHGNVQYQVNSSLSQVFPILVKPSLFWSTCLCQFGKSVSSFPSQVVPILVYFSAHLQGRH